MTTMTAAITPRVNTRPSHTFSTTQTNGMISSFAICRGAISVSLALLLATTAAQDLSRLIKGALARHARRVQARLDCVWAHLVEANGIQHEGEVQRNDGQVSGGSEQKEVCSTSKSKSEWHLCAASQAQKGCGRRVVATEQICLKIDIPADIMRAYPALAERRALRRPGSESPRC